MNDLAQFAQTIGGPATAMLLLVVVGSMAWERVAKVKAISNGGSIEAQLLTQLERLADESTAQTQVLSKNGEVLQENAVILAGTTAKASAEHTAMIQSLGRIEGKG